MYIYIYIYIYELHTISYQTCFLGVIKNCRSRLLLYIIWDDWPILMISGLNEQLQQELEYTILKLERYSWWISKMQSDTLEERYAIKFRFKHMEYFRLLLEHLAWIEHQFLCGIRDSMKPGCLWGMMRGVGGVRKSIDQRWLAKGLGLGLICWGFKEVQQEIPSEEASTLQIGSVAFPLRQCSSPQLHPCHRLFDQDRHQDSSSASLLSRRCSLWLLVIPQAQRLSLWDNWGDERGCDEVHWHADTRGLPWSLPEFVGTVEQLHSSRRRLLRRGVEFHMRTINKSAHSKKVWKLI